MLQRISGMLYNINCKLQRISCMLQNISCMLQRISCMLQRISLCYRGSVVCYRRLSVCYKALGVCYRILVGYLQYQFVICNVVFGIWAILKQRILKRHASYAFIPVVWLICKIFVKLLNIFENYQVVYKRWQNVKFVVMKIK